jgi:signal transduction histidine kinase
VLANLLSNAIKFSPPGAAIQLSAARKQESVEISVLDQGPGFPDQLAAQLERYEKVFSTTGSAGESGLGLGLTLTREHLQRMGGNLTLRRGPSGGSEAVIVLSVA